MQRQCCDVGASRAKPEPPGQMPGGFFRSTGTALPVSVPGGRVVAAPAITSRRRRTVQAPEGDDRSVR